MRRLSPESWMIPDSVRVHRQGVTVGRLLVDRLADAAAQRGHRVLLVHQWHPLSETASAGPVIRRARERGLPFLQLEPLLRGEIARHPDGTEGLFHIEHRPGRVVVVGHMTAFGNEVAARAIARRLEAL